MPARGKSRTKIYQGWKRFYWNVKTVRLSFCFASFKNMKVWILEKELVQGCTPGNRSYGRHRRRWTDDIIEWTGWRSTKQQDRLRIEIFGEEYYAPPTLHLEDGTERRRLRRLKCQLHSRVVRIDSIHQVKEGYLNLSCFDASNVRDLYSIYG